MTKRGKYSYATLADSVTEVDLEHHFQRSDGDKWTCVAPVGLNTRRGRIDIAVGTTFSPGTNILGVDMAFVLKVESERREQLEAEERGREGAER